jgi:phosphoribosylformylglycinamidine synthase I
MKIGVLRFPGTNCDRDVLNAAIELGHDPEFLWHRDHFDPKKYEAYILPGGFSYGDYLRSGALAAIAPAMDDVKTAAQQGRPVLGICNGFQILCEARLLPGALLRNSSQRFVDRWVELNVENGSSVWGPGAKKKIKLPVAHGDGRFTASDVEVQKLFDANLVWLTYDKNVNGSTHQIAGVLNAQKNVAGLMPHPERALHDWMGTSDGRSLFSSLMSAVL